MPKIKEIECHKVLNSRGDWTIETTVKLDDGAVGVQAVPEGASKGENEAVSIAVDRAVPIVSDAIAEALKGENPFEQKVLDKVLIDMDGTKNKSHLGGNSILSVSLATARAAAMSQGLELYQYIGHLFDGKPKQREGLRFPTPVFNILNGGKHAGNDLSFQEFMIIPASDVDFDEQIQMGVTVYKSLEANLEKDDFETGVGDEGGFAPENFTVEKALEYIKNSASEDYIVGKQIFMGMDVAAESFYFDGMYEIKEENLKLDASALGAKYVDLINKYPIIFLEDPYYEKDIVGWQFFYSQFKDKLMIVADDLVVTNPVFLKTAIEQNMANAVIVKPNQVGTLSETLDFVKMAKNNNMQLCISHRSGDTAEDTFIADLALGVGAEFIKAGAPVRGERVVKYNRLLDVFYSS